VKSPDQTGDFTSCRIVSSAIDGVCIGPQHSAKKHRAALIPHLFDNTTELNAFSLKSRLECAPWYGNCLL